MLLCTKVNLQCFDSQVQERAEGESKFDMAFSGSVGNGDSYCAVTLPSPCIVSYCIRISQTSSALVNGGAVW